MAAFAVIAAIGFAFDRTLIVSAPAPDLLADSELRSGFAVSVRER